jgi:hypothetical protein
MNSRVVLHLVAIRPQTHEPTGELAAIVSKYDRRPAVPGDQAVEYRYYVLAAQALTHLDGQRFATEDVDDRQRAQASAIDQLIGDEVHRPRLARRRDHEAGVPLHDHLAALGRLLRS